MHAAFNCSRPESNGSFDASPYTIYSLYRRSGSGSRARNRCGDICWLAAGQLNPPPVRPPACPSVHSYVGPSLRSFVRSFIRSFARLSMRKDVRERPKSENHAAASGDRLQRRTPPHRTRYVHGALAEKSTMVASSPSLTKTTIPIQSTRTDRKSERKRDR